MHSLKRIMLALMLVAIGTVAVNSAALACPGSEKGAPASEEGE